MTARFRIERVDGPSHGDLYELGEDWEFRVIEVASGRVVMTFDGHSFSKLDNASWKLEQEWGAKDVSLSPDGRSVRVRDTEGNVKTVPLPEV